MIALNSTSLVLKMFSKVIIDNFNLSFHNIFTVSALIKHKDGWPFDRPITKAEVPDYHLHVKTPMDLGTIKYAIFSFIMNSI